MLRTIEDYDGFKYFRRVIFEAEISALIKTVDDIKSNPEVSNFIAKHDKFENYEYNLDGEMADKIALRGIAAGLILTADDTARSYREYVENHFKLKEYSLEELGPRIGDVSWAQGLRSAANYIRHQREWAELARERAKKAGLLKNGYLSYSKGNMLKNAIFPLGNKMADLNVEILLKLGVDFEDLLPGPAYMFWELCEFLGLHKKEIALKHFNDFQLEIENKFQV